MTSAKTYKLTYWRFLFLIAVLASLFYGLFSQPLIILADDTVVGQGLHLGETLVSMSHKENVPNEVISAVRKDLSRRTNIAANEFKISKISQEMWPDGCLGLATAEEMCTQALVEGWRVTMSHGDHTWVYRTNDDGRIVRLEK